jgi:hypothetical protein
VFDAYLGGIMAAANEPIVWEFRHIWRAAGIGVAIGVTFYCLARFYLAKTGEPLLGVGGLALAAILAGTQLLTRRDVLTPLHLVQQRGLLGRRHVKTPLQTITRVDFYYPAWHRAWSIGHIQLMTDGGEIRLAAVVNAGAGAQEILTAKSHLVSKEAP